MALDLIRRCRVGNSAREARVSNLEFDAENLYLNSVFVRDEI